VTALIDRKIRFFSRLPVGGRKRITVPAGALPILSPGALLAAPQRQVLLRKLDTLVSVSAAHYEALYLAAIERFAKLVQQLPASEAHHHAGEGGLLDHSLEVAVIALQLRRGYLLPPGALPEDQARLQDLWTYAVFTAALVHDLGKAVVDQRVHLFDDRGRSAGVGDAWQGPMPEPFGRAIG